MSWTDDELDELFRSASNEEQSFVYKEEYWGEMESLLPDKKSGKDLLWTITALLFTSIIISGFFRNPDFEQIDQSKSLSNVSNIISSKDDQEPSSNYLGDQFVAENTSSNSPNEGAPINSSSLQTSSKVLSTKDQTLSMGITEPAITDFKAEVAKPIEEKIDNLPIRDYLNENTPRPLLPLQTNAVVSSTNHSLYIQSLVGASQSLVTPSGNISGSFGLGAGWALRKGNFVLNTGVSVLVSNYSDLHLTRTAKVYGFGSELYAYNFNYRQLYDLEGHLELGYQKHRSEFKVGVRPSYLMSARVVVESWKPDATTFENDNTSDQHVYTYTGGLKRFGLKPTIGYAFHLNTGLELGINAGFQLMNKIDEDYLQGETRRFALDGQIYLRKNFSWNKK